jgi:hypothetical protein
MAYKSNLNKIEIWELLKNSNLNKIEIWELLKKSNKIRSATSTSLRLRGGSWRREEGASYRR